MFRVVGKNVEGHKLTAHTSSAVMEHGEIIGQRGMTGKVASSSSDHVRTGKKGRRYRHGFPLWDEVNI